jgi:DNA-directed RNA polymerase specialized sigma24 family protein
VTAETDEGWVDTHSLVSEALTQLQPLHREVIHKAVYLGWTTGHIAADLNVTEAVVKYRLHDALRTLRLNLIDATQPRRPAGMKRRRYDQTSL